jgi:hypothetical protein
MAKGWEVGGVCRAAYVALRLRTAGHVTYERE